MVPDIVSKRVADNTSSLESLTNAVQNLPSKLSTTLFEPVTNCCDGLNKLISSIKTQLDHLSASVKSFSHSVVVSSPPSLVRSVQNTSSLLRPSHSTMDHKSHTQYDRSRNVILFGLPEFNLLDTKSAIDLLSIFLVGKAIMHFSWDVHLNLMPLSLPGHGHYLSNLKVLVTRDYCLHLLASLKVTPFLGYF